MMKKDLFLKVGGFDKKYFLYFEEFDLALRIGKLGFKSYIIPEAKVFHEWGASTKKERNIDKVFTYSRRYYFKKNFGLVGLLVEYLFLSMSKTKVLLYLILVLGIYLRFAQIQDSMIFIGDQGWFYLSARSLLVDGHIPLVGIPSSVVWLAQGPLATYFIAVALFLGNMHPVAPAILFAFFDTLTIILVFVLSKKVFNEKVALFGAAMYAASPLVVLTSKMPYHTSAIPLFACLFFLVYIKSLKNTSWILVLLFLFGLLLQLELSNVVLIPAIALLLWNRRNKITRALYGTYLLSFLFGILPFILFDITHKFIQTAGFPLWIINRTRLFFGLTLSGNSTTSSLPNAFQTVFQQLTTFYSPHSITAAIFMMLCLITGLFFLVRSKNVLGIKIIVFSLVIPLGAFFLHAAPGAAYFPLIFPSLAILTGFTVTEFDKKVKYTGVIFYTFLLISSFLIVKNNFYISSVTEERKIPSTGYNFGVSWKAIDQAALALVQLNNGKEFSIEGKDFYAMYPSSLDNLTYLIMYRGGNLNAKAKRVFYVYPAGKSLNIQDLHIAFENKYYVITYEEK